MRTTSAALCLAAAIGLICCQSAGAVPAASAATAAAAATISPLQQAQYREHRTRHGIVKCYRDFVIGQYRCHYYRQW